MKFKPDTDYETRNGTARLGTLASAIGDAISFAHTGKVNHAHLWHEQDGRCTGADSEWRVFDIIVPPSAVDNPPHYTTGSIEVIDFIEDKQLGFHLGNVVKYVVRADHKGKPVEDLKKAAWYLNREIERRVRPDGSVEREAGR